MKIKTALLSFTFSAVAIFANAQRILPQQWMDQANVGDRHINVGNKTMLFGTKQTGVEGDYYWDKDWQTANVYFYSQKYVGSGGKMVSLDSVNNIDLKIDIWNDLLEFNAEDGIKTIPTKYVSNVITKTKDNSIMQFINPREFGQTNIKGFFELLATGPRGSLLSSREIIKQAANYVPALGTGNQNTQLVKKDHTFIFTNGVLSEIKNKKDLLEAMGNLQDKIEDYAKKEKLKGKSEDDMKTLVDYYNTL